MNKPTNFHAAASELEFETRAFINGKYVDAASGKTFDSINPATGKVITSLAACGEEDVNRAVSAARNAFDAGSWAHMAPADRKDVLLKWAEIGARARVLGGEGGIELTERAVAGVLTWDGRCEIEVLDN